MAQATLAYATSDTIASFTALFFSMVTKNKKCNRIFIVDCGSKLLNLTSAISIMRIDCFKHCLGIYNEHKAKKIRFVYCFLFCCQCCVVNQSLSLEWIRIIIAMLLVFKDSCFCCFERVHRPYSSFLLLFSEINKQRHTREIQLILFFFSYKILSTSFNHHSFLFAISLSKYCLNKESPIFFS